MQPFGCEQDQNNWYLKAVGAPNGVQGQVRVSTIHHKKRAVTCRRADGCPVHELKCGDPIFPVTGVLSSVDRDLVGEGSENALNGAISLTTHASCLDLADTQTAAQVPDPLGDENVLAIS